MCYDEVHERRRAYEEALDHARSQAIELFTSALAHDLLFTMQRAQGWIFACESGALDVAEDTQDATASSSSPLQIIFQAPVQYYIDPDVLALHGMDLGTVLRDAYERARGVVQCEKSRFIHFHVYNTMYLYFNPLSVAQDQ